MESRHLLCVRRLFCQLSFCNGDRTPPADSEVHHYGGMKLIAVFCDALRDIINPIPILCAILNHMLLVALTNSIRKTYIFRDI